MQSDFLVKNVVVWSSRTVFVTGNRLYPWRLILMVKIQIVMQSYKDAHAMVLTLMRPVSIVWDLKLILAGK